MSRYSDDYYGFAPYVSVAEKKKRNQKAIAKLKKKNADLKPVVIEGRSIAGTWWGKSWNANLERYADYSNRVGRGRSYVRHGAVLDLQISAGVVNALVQGSRAKPYEVEIKIKKLSDEIWQTLKHDSLAQLESLSELLSGKFPKSLQELFFSKGEGIFPAPKEISFDCSCPDWASMCKHVASVLYGIGNRLDWNPELLFELRQVSINELVDSALSATTENLIDKANAVSDSDILADDDLEDVFGIAMDDSLSPEISLPSVESFHSDTTSDRSSKAKRGPKKKNESTKKASGKVPVKASRPAKKGKPTKSSSRKRRIKPRPGQMTDQLLDAVASLKGNFGMHDICRLLTAWTQGQISNALQRAIQNGRIERVGRGVYTVV